MYVCNNMLFVQTKLVLINVGMRNDDPQSASLLIELLHSQEYSLLSGKCSEH